MLGGALVEQLVDTVLTPAGLIQLMQRGDIDPQASVDSATGNDTTVQMEYQTWERFAVMITSTTTGHTTTVILQRNGLWEWRVTEIRLPLPE